MTNNRTHPTLTGTIYPFKANSLSSLTPFVNDNSLSQVEKQRKIVNFTHDFYKNIKKKYNT